MRDRIETDRLILRPLEISDAPAIHHHCRDGSIARNTARIPDPYPLLAAELYVLSVRAGAGRKAGYVYAIADRQSDALVGASGVFKRHPDAPDWEIGYWIGPDARGRGIATEAAAGLISAASADLTPRRITAGHFDDNPASGRVLARLGFTYTGETTRLFCMGRLAYATSLDMVLEN
ncbi:GNAT family N-acetyltransferase [Hyphobacterium sp.]|uniref:GNAT family N-acetyltransferase n=1 Tax=Hyphobacterium sp. TaxID=2004662 RepID=UPI00374A2C10